MNKDQLLKSNPSRLKEENEIYIARTIGETFIEKSIEVYPILGEDIGLRRMYCYISMQIIKNKGSRKIVLPAKVLEKIEGKNRGKHFRAKEYIEKFSELVIPLEIKEITLNPKGGEPVKCEYSYKYRKAREVECIKSKRYEELLELIKVGDKRVYIDTLKELRRDRVGKYKSSNDVVRQIDESLSKSDRLQIELLNLLNRLPNNRFTSVVSKGMPKLEEKIKHSENKHLANYVEQLLDEIAINPKPIYKPSERGLTSRIFTSNSYLNLPRDMREMLLEDCIKVDIRSSQFAIIAQLWGIKSIIEFLDNGGSLWEELFRWLGLENENATNRAIIKDAMKRFTYSAIYGMAKGRLQYNFRTEVLESIPDLKLEKRSPSGKRHSLGIYLSQHPFFKELFTQRGTYINKIKKDKGILCPDGKWLSLEGTTPQSLLACMAQRAEMIAMEPLIEIMKAEEAKSHIHKDRTNKFLCMGWLHDGVYIKTPKKEISMWISRLMSISSRLKDSIGLSYDISPPSDSSFAIASTKTFLHSDNQFHSYPESSSSKPFLGRNARTQSIYLAKA